MKANRRTNPESLENIKRIDGVRTHGFQVYIQRQKKVHTKLFSDSVFASKARAREAAILYRDFMLDRLPPSFTELGIQPTPRSNTGLTGISFTFGRSSSTKSKKLPCFSVSVRPEMGKTLNRHIYLTDKSYKEGLKEAIKLRNTILAEREDKLLKAKNR